MGQSTGHVARHRERHVHDGAHVKEFEARFAEWQGSRFAVMVNSGSSSNLLMVPLSSLRRTLS